MPYSVMPDTASIWMRVKRLDKRAGGRSGGGVKMRRIRRRLAGRTVLKLRLSGFSDFMPKSPDVAARDKPEVFTTRVTFNPSFWRADQLIEAK